MPEHDDSESFTRLEDLPFIDAKAPVRRAHVAIWSVTFISAAGLAAALLCHMNVTVAADATLVPSQDAIPVESIVDGRVAEVFVHDGDVVRPGDRILRLEADYLSAAIEPLSEEYAAVEDRVTWLTALLSSTRASRSELVPEPDNARGSNRQSTEQALDLVAPGERVQRPLSLHVLAGSKLGPDSGLYTALLDAKERAAKLHHELALARSHEAERTLTSLHGGTIQEFRKHQPGYSVRKGDVVGWIVPQQQGVFAEVPIPPEAIGVIDAGQEIQIVLPANMSRDSVFLRGTVVSISNYSRNAGSIQFNATQYVARVCIDIPAGGSDRDRLSLKPGMHGRAEITLRRSRVASALLQRAGSAQQ